MSGPLEGQTILITGAASGIGRATALKLAAQGTKLALQDINEPGLASVAHELIQINSNTRWLTRCFDVANTIDCKDFADLIVKVHGTINHVFNCAGVNPTAIPLEETTDVYWNKLMNTNLKGTFNVTRACAPHMGAGSTFVNTASILGQCGSPQKSVYCATKWGVIGFSKSVALEFGSRGIRTNIIAPGDIETPTNASVVLGREAVEKSVEKVALRRLGTAEEVANMVVWLMSPESAYCNGSVFEINGGLQ